MDRTGTGEISHAAIVAESAPHVPVDRIARELAALEADGKLMPEHVVDYARDPSTALHGCFEWDDGEAAQRWRLHQARQIIRCRVQIVERTAEPVRAYVSLRSEWGSGGGYRPLVSVLTDAELRAALLEQAKADARAWARKYRQLTELAAVFAAIEQLE
jgi:hypothetical protein